MKVSMSHNRVASSSTPVTGEQFEYAFDDIGNRTSAAEGGDSQGRNLRRAGYAANNLNQYTSRDVPPYLTVLGSAATNATVSLWGDNGSFASTYRRNDFFRGELNFNNSTGSLWLTVTNVGVLRNGTNADIATNIIGSAFVPQTAETFGYDADGNMTNDGRWAITWDGENHLLTMVSLTNTPSASKLRLTFGYDNQSRRIFKTVENWSGSAWSITLSNKFIYDGWNLIAELNGTNNALIHSYTWGADASGTIHGAGGVGGLVSMTVHSGPSAGTYFYCYDGNFNVIALVNAANSTLAAQYEYSPFGEALRATGRLNANCFLFSTKLYDEETGLSDYGRRYYGADRGTWLCRDPIAERGGDNLYAINRNDVVNSVDRDGRITVTEGPAFIRDLGCGGYYVNFTFTLDNPNPPTGYGVQKVTLAKSVLDCAGRPKETGLEVFWEYFRWGGRNTQAIDTSSAVPHPQSQGDVTALGEIKFYSREFVGALENDPTWKSTRGRGPNVETEPWFWMYASDNGEGDGSRAAWSSWDCCCWSHRSEVFASP